MEGSETRVLLHRAAEGSDSAVRKLFQVHRPRLCQMVKLRMDRRLVGRLDASDIVQESLATAYRRLPDYLTERPMEFYPWIRSITWNCLVDAYRRHIAAERRSVKREVAPNIRLNDQSASHLMDRLIDQDEMIRVTRREMRARLLDALDRISADFKEVLVLRFLEQLTVRETAQTLHISESAVRTRQVRAIQSLRDILNPTGEDHHD